MRRLVQPDVSRHAVIAAGLTAALCYPRFVLWAQRTHPVWYLEAVTFCGSFVLWAFVFAWHTACTQRPVFTWRISTKVWLAATGAGMLAAFILHQFLDPSLHRATPEDYPADLAQWVAMTLFSLSLNQLFLVFAPVAWLMRLSRRRSVAVALTVLFDVSLLLLKSHWSAEPFPPTLLVTLVAVRLGLAGLAVGFYLHGGVWLATWLALLVQARHLLGPLGH